MAVLGGGGGGGGGHELLKTSWKSSVPFGPAADKSITDGSDDTEVGFRRRSLLDSSSLFYSQSSTMVSYQVINKRCKSNEDILCSAAGVLNLTRLI